MENGASEVYACASHPVLSGPAVENISQSHFTEVVVTNTIPLSEAAQKRAQDQGSIDRGFDRTGDPVDSRRNVRQQIIFVDRNQNYGNCN